MKPVMSFLVLAAFAASGDALAVGRLADVTIIDRDSGAALRTYYSRGEYWVAGRPGARYSIEIRNCSGGRLLAVASVDGVNVLSGATAAWDQGGYVFDPAEHYDISGWRKSHEEVADFTFTDAGDSYAGRTGRPANVGVIGVAVFRERPPEPVYLPKRIAPAAGGPPQAPAGADEARASAGASVSEPAVSAPKLGTGHGEREYSYVVDTEFRRMQREPNEVIRIRYDSLENLVAMGIVRRPRPPGQVPDPFPGSDRRAFVPDPPG